MKPERELKKRKHKYRINRRTASKMLYAAAMELLFSAGKRFAKSLKKIEGKIVIFLSPVRKGRDFVRNFSDASHSTCHCRVFIRFWHWSSPYSPPVAGL